MNVKFFVTMFGCVELSSATSNELFASVNTEAIKRGYLVTKEACSEELLEWLKGQDLNPNSTFYKTWVDVTSKSRVELYLDQVKHYLTTYGGIGDRVYIPNENPEEVSFKGYTVISAISREEMVERILALLESGIALKDESVETIVEYLEENKDLMSDSSLKRIKNRNTKLILCDRLGLFPTNPDELLRYIVFKVTGKVTFVKNAEMIQAIKTGQDFDLCRLSQERLLDLSRIFKRNSSVFVALKKKGLLNGKIVNRLRRMSDLTHTPQKKSPLETLLSKEYGPTEILRIIENLTSFKIVSLLTEFKVRQEHPELRDKLFVIRNGKMWIRKDYVPARMNSYYYGMVCQILKDVLIERMSKKASGIKIRVPEDIQVPLPTSEKNFIGGYPLGTSINLAKNTFIGCYWRGEWGTDDYDLHYGDIQGHDYGWNSSYYDESEDAPQIVYSGDMTRANPEAAEVFYLKNKVVSGVVRVNRFSCDQVDGLFRLFVAVEDTEPSLITRNYMVDPGSIIFKADITHSLSKREVSVGVVDSDSQKLILLSLESGNSQVGSSNYSQAIVDNLVAKAQSMPSAIEYLIEAGAIVSTDPMEDVDIDFSDLHAEKLIEIMS